MTIPAHGAGAAMSEPRAAGRAARPERFWIARIIGLAVGWRLAMSYPLDDSQSSLLLSLGIGTLGVVIVGVISYCAGRIDGEAEALAAAGATEEAGDER